MVVLFVDKMSCEEIYVKLKVLKSEFDRDVVINLWL